MIGILVKVLVILLILSPFLLVGGVILAIFLYVKNIREDQKAMIVRSYSPEPMKLEEVRSSSDRYPLTSLKWGIVAMAIGLGFLVTFIIQKVYPIQESGELFIGIIFVLAGLGLLLYYAIASKKNVNSESRQSGNT